MSATFVFNLSLIWVVVLLSATLLNYIKSKQKLFISGVFVSFMYAAVHIANTLWLREIPLKEVLGIHYLFFAGASLVTAVGLFLINKDKPRVMINITIVLLIIEAMLGYAVHLDRNILALNGAVEPNMLGASKWWLWDLRFYVSFANTFTVFLAITLPRTYQVKTDDNNQALKVLDSTEEYLQSFDDTSKIKQQAQAYLYIGVQALCELSGEKNKDNYCNQIGIDLLNRGIKKCCYEPGRTEPVGIFGRFVYWLRS